MIQHSEIADAELRSQIKHKNIVLGGNSNLKIYGTLQCKSGKRLKKTNRVFFSSEKEAIEMGYRPCGHCLKSAYQEYKIRHLKVKKQEIW